jgi:hypothetical protein
MAQFAWLEGAVDLSVAGRSAPRAYVWITPTVPDRAAVFFEDNGTTVVRFLYEGRTDSGVPVEFNRKEKVPALAAMPLQIYTSGLLPKYPPIDQSKIAGDPAMKTVVVASDILAALPTDCSRVIVNDDVVVAVHGYAPGNLAQKDDLVRATVAPLAAIGSAALTITHSHYPSLTNQALINELLKLTPAGTQKTIVSFGHDAGRGLDCYADEKAWYYRLRTQKHSGWTERPLANADTIRGRLAQCHSHTGAGHRESSSGSWTDQDLDAVKALTCLDGRTALLAWHRHPRFYSLSK